MIRHYIEPEGASADGHVSLVVVTDNASGLGPNLAPRRPHPRAPFFADSLCRWGVFILGADPDQAGGQKQCKTQQPHDEMHNNIECCHAVNLPLYCLISQMCVPYK